MQDICGILLFVFKIYCHTQLAIILFSEHHIKKVNFYSEKENGAYYTHNRKIFHTQNYFWNVYCKSPTNSDEDYNWSWCSWFDCKFFRDFGLLIEGGHIKGSST